jgi:hypothetical protein
MQDRAYGITRWPALAGFVGFSSRRTRSLAWWVCSDEPGSWRAVAVNAGGRSLAAAYGGRAPPRGPPDLIRWLPEEPARQILALQLLEPRCDFQLRCDSLLIGIGDHRRA